MVTFSLVADKQTEIDIPFVHKVRKALRNNQLTDREIQDARGHKSYRSLARRLLDRFQSRY